MTNGDTAVPVPKLGIDETKEVLVAVNQIAIFLLLILLDGLQVFKDVRAIIAKLKDDDDFRIVLQNAVDNIKAVPAEVRDLDAGEIIQLSGIQLEYLPKILAAVKRASAAKKVLEQEAVEESHG